MPIAPIMWRIVEKADMMPIAPEYGEFLRKQMKSRWHQNVENFL